MLTRPTLLRHRTALPIVLLAAACSQSGGTGPVQQGSSPDVPTVAPPVVVEPGAPVTPPAIDMGTGSGESPAMSPSSPELPNMAPAVPPVMMPPGAGTPAVPPAAQEPAAPPAQEPLPVTPAAMGSVGAPAVVPPGADPPVDVPNPPAVPPATPPAVDPWREAWGQAGGPDGSWQVEGQAPIEWSVARNQNIRYRTPLPNGGQGGIAVYGDRAFFTTFKPISGPSRTATDILGHAADANTGEILWSVELTGHTESRLMFAFSDSTSLTPVTDGEHVWFYNASGKMGAWDMEGNEVWTRDFAVQDTLQDGNDTRFNKQFEPFLVGDVIVNMEPVRPGEPAYKRDTHDWNYLRGINKLTGEVVWTSESGVTHYSTPVSGMLEGKPVVMFGRGGYHNVPEAPRGLSLMSLDTQDAGKDIWNKANNNAEGMFSQVWDDKYAYWFSKGANASHLVYDVKAGELLRTQSLQRGVDVRQWNKAEGSHDLKANVNIPDIEDTVFGGKMNAYPHWSSNLVVAGYHYFTTHTNNTRNRVGGTHGGPAFSVGRVNVETGKVEYLEVPVGVRPDGTRVYGENLMTKVEDNQGNDLPDDDRSREHGWRGPAFFGTPTAVGNVLYMTAQLGITYVIQADAEVFDAEALLAANDLGPLGDTWTLNSVSYSRGRLYHRTAKELICIEVPSAAAP